jgi:hypothetical protein
VVPASADGSKTSEAICQEGPCAPVRQPYQLGCLAVMLLASSIAEVKLGVPAVSIRLGLQVHHLHPPAAFALPVIFGSLWCKSRRDNSGIHALCATC